MTATATTEHRTLTTKQLADECKAHSWEQIIHGPEDGYTRRYNARDRLDGQGVKVSRTPGKKGGVIVKTADETFLAVELVSPSKAPKKPGGDPIKTRDALKGPFPLATCKRLLELEHTRQTVTADLAEAKGNRKDLKAEISADEDEIEATIAEEEKAGRAGDGKPFSGKASKKLVGLRRDVDRKSKRLDGMETRIAEMNDRLREAKEETFRLISEQDPTDNLFKAHEAAKANET